MKNWLNLLKSQIAKNSITRFYLIEKEPIAIHFYKSHIHLNLVKEVLSQFITNYN